MRICLHWIVTRTLLVAFVLTGIDRASATDWLQWRGDAQRSGASPQEVPTELNLQWLRQLPPLTPAWPDEPRQQFDGVYEPVAAHGMVYVGSSANDSLTAIDARTGAVRWRFFVDGPVRYAPVSGRAKCVMLNNGENTVEMVEFLCDILQRMQQHQRKKMSTLRKLSISEVGRH